MNTTTLTHSTVSNFANGNALASLNTNGRTFSQNNGSLVHPVIADHAINLGKYKQDPVAISEEMQELAKDLTQAGLNVDSSKFIAQSTWQTFRAAGYQLYGSIRNKFANVYIPTGNGYYTRLFSFQKSDITGDVIEDCLSIEMSHQKIKQIFGTEYIGLGDKNLLNPATMHIGKLTDEAWALYLDCATQGAAISEPYVLYCPFAFDWTAEAPQRKSNNKNKLLAAAMAAAALLTN